MGQKQLSPATVVASIVAVLVLIGAIYYFGFSGRPASTADQEAATQVEPPPVGGRR